MGVHVRCVHRGVDYNRPLGLNKKNTRKRSREPPSIVGSGALASTATVESFSVQISPFSSTPRGAVGAAPNGRFDGLSSEQTLLNVTALLNAGERKKERENDKGSVEEREALHG